jgi:anti-sigma factor RsiW
MNCKAFESLVALHIEGDLKVSDRRRVESHLQVCTTCSDLAEDLRQSQSVFKALRTGTVSSSDLSGVRQRVLNEVGALEPAPGWVLMMHRLFAGIRRRNAIAGVVLAALITGAVWYSLMPFAREGKTVDERRPFAVVDVARFESPEPAGLTNVIHPLPAARRIVKPDVPQEISDVISTEDSSVQFNNDEDSSSSETSQIIPFKFVTDDPDIIIYWLPTDKGD